MLNAISIDVEDWRQLVVKHTTGEEIRPSDVVVDEVQAMLSLFETYTVKATFFVLYNIAKTFPRLVREIDAAGHEIGCHGMSHDLIYMQTPQVFRDETTRAKKTLEDIIGKRIVGYRAAAFSVTPRSRWALDILAETGFTYDSSIFPCAGKRYGIPGFSKSPVEIKTANGRNITEVPLTVVNYYGINWRIAGGGYFRLMPYGITAKAIRKVNLEQRPAVVYLHPYEYALKKLMLPPGSISMHRIRSLIRYQVFHNISRKRIPKRLQKLIQDFKFSTIYEVIKNGGYKDKSIL